MTKQKSDFPSAYNTATWKSLLLCRKMKLHEWLLLQEFWRNLLTKKLANKLKRILNNDFTL